MFSRWFRSAPESKPLKLLAEAPEDVVTLSAVLQDALIRFSDMRYEPAARRFVIEMDRYCHELAGSGTYRTRAALAIHGVDKAASKCLDPEETWVLLTLSAEPLESPSHRLEMVFASERGDAPGLRLEVECLDILLADLTPPRRSRFKPRHGI